MTNVASIASAALAKPQPDQRREVSLTTRKLFVLFHGQYGSLFTAKFSTGESDAQGKDKGVRSAMLVWDSALSRFPGDVVEMAAYRVIADNPQFPPNLPQLEAACRAAMPREVYSDGGVPQLPPPVVAPLSVSIQAVGDGKDWARRIVVRAEQGDKTIRRTALEMAARVLGGAYACPQ